MLGNNQKLRTTRIPRTLPMRQMPIALRGLLCVGFIFDGTFFRAVFGGFQAAYMRLGSLKRIGKAK